MTAVFRYRGRSWAVLRQDLTDRLPNRIVSVPKAQTMPGRIWDAAGDIAVAATAMMWRSWESGLTVWFGDPREGRSLAD
ncbi:hypothetical protein BW14_05760 [Bifidobacterium sp. UTBIF-68]|nr:hypothetical protein BW14_05760 [Bifidobacterium sp. UTBIF-68]